MLTKCSKCSLVVAGSKTTVSSPLSTITSSMNSAGGGGGSSSNMRAVTVVLLDNSTLDVVVDVKSSVGDLFQKVCDLLQLKEYDIFALASKKKNEYHFLPAEKELSKLINSNKRHVSQSGNSQFFVPNPVFTGINATTQAPSSAFVKTSSAAVGTGAAPALSYVNAAFYFQNSAPVAAKLGMANPVYESSEQQPTSQMVASTTSHGSSQSSTSSSISFLNLFTKSTSSSMSKSQFCTCPIPLIEATSTPHSNLTYYFRVKFYVRDPLLLRNPQTRYLYYLQLRQNYLNLYYLMSEERYFALASLAIVADFGPYNPSIHFGRYFDSNLYFPSWVISKLGDEYIYANMPQLHANLSSLSANSAQTKFCAELSNHDYPFNLHVYNVYKNKEETPGTICLGIAPEGIFVFELRDLQELSLISTFPWLSISKLSTDRKKFEITNKIETKVRCYTYYTRCDKFPKYMLELCKLTHSFTSNLFARLADQKNLAKYMHEAYTEKVNSISVNPFESYQEREIHSISMVEKTEDAEMDEEKPDSAADVDVESEVKFDQLPHVVNILSAEEVSLLEAGKLETIEEEETTAVSKQQQQQEQPPPIQQADNLSSSFTSSSSSYYETALGLNNATNDTFTGVVNYSANSEDFPLQELRNISVIQIGSTSSLTSPSLASAQLLLPDSSSALLSAQNSTTSLKSASNASELRSSSSSKPSSSTSDIEQQENFSSSVQRQHQFAFQPSSPTHHVANQKFLTENQALASLDANKSTYNHLYQQNQQQQQQQTTHFHKYNQPNYSNFKKSNFIDTTDYSRENQILLRNRANLDNSQLSSLQQLSSDSHNSHQPQPQPKQLNQQPFRQNLDMYQMASQQAPYALMSPGNSSGLSYRQTFSAGNSGGGLARSSSLNKSNLISSASMPPLSPFPPPVPTLPPPPMPTHLPTGSGALSTSASYHKQPLQGTRSNDFYAPRYEQHFYSASGQINQQHLTHEFTNLTFSNAGKLAAYGVGSGHPAMTNNNNNNAATVTMPTLSNKTSSDQDYLPAFKHLKSQISPSSTSSSSSSLYLLFRNSSNMGSNNSINPASLSSQANSSPTSLFYHKHKDPPSYEESIKRIKSHSNQSSSSFDDSDSNASKSTSSFRNDSNHILNASHQNIDQFRNKRNPYLSMMNDDFERNTNFHSNSFELANMNTNGYFDHNNNNNNNRNEKNDDDDDDDIDEKRSIKFSNDDDTDDEVINDEDFVRTDDDDDLMDTNMLSRTNTLINTAADTDDKQNEISLSIENLEQIRSTAESMSLPLLTALCNDSSVIRCLSHHNSNRSNSSSAKPDEKIKPVRMRRSCNKSSVKYLWKTDDKELEYNNSCLSHRFFSRNCSKRCRSRSASSMQQCVCENCACSAQNDKITCPGCKQKHADDSHFCTASSVASSYRTETAHSLTSSDRAFLSATSSSDNPNTSSLARMNESIVVCENYSPSYLSKKDQMESVQKEIKQLRLSKAIMRKTMQDIDKLLDETDPEKCAARGLNPVERFYKSDKFIGSSMNVTSLNKDLPREDIAPAKYIFELNQQKKPEERIFPLYGTAIFSLKNPHAFTDKTILEHELKNKPKKPASKLVRPKSAAAIVYYRSQLKTK